MKKKGKLIVIDGNDGSGKETQFRILLERLKKEKHKVETIDFPRYYSNVFGELIGECLAGERGDFLNLDPRIASTLFAADRFESKAQIEEWLSQGKIVLADRYVSANQMHQGGKIRNARERREFLEWLDRIEHDVFGIPRPDKIIYISLPIKMNQELLNKKENKEAKKYLKGKKDVHEESAEFLENSRKNALKIVAEHNNWHKVDCNTGSKLRTIEDIHEDVYIEVTKIL